MAASSGRNSRSGAKDSSCFSSAEIALRLTIRADMLNRRRALTWEFEGDAAESEPATGVGQIPQLGADQKREPCEARCV
jgi:hypothetical protein